MAVSKKTQVIMVSKDTVPPDTLIPTISLGLRPLPLQASISIVGLEMDSALTFPGHIKTMARKATWKLSCVWWTTHLDTQEIFTL